MQIMCGMGHRPIGNHLFNKVRKGNPMVDGQLETVYNDWRKYADRTIESVKEMQSTFEFLQENIYCQLIMSIDFNRYEEFVSAVTSDASTNFVDFADRIGELDREGANIERLLTAGVGINAEGGEFLEIVKKMVFQGKPWNEDNREHLIIELGDILWYVAQATMALGIEALMKSLRPT